MERAIERWHELCETVEQSDGLPSWEEAGHWTEKKLYFWKRYIDITTHAMTGNPAFSGGLVYVDLFAGAGVCTLKESGRRFPGSALIAASAAKPFEKLILCEKAPDLAQACAARLAKTKVRDRSEVLTGDCNELICQIAKRIPPRSLTLAFIDPRALDAKFDTIAKLSQQRRVDFVVLFADAYDINRNAEYHYREDPNSKLDQVLGPDSNWRDRLDQLGNPSSINKRRLFAEIYRDQLRCRLEYTHFGEKVISHSDRPLYRLVYASKSQLGLKFWNEALKEDSSGQGWLF